MRLTLRTLLAYLDDILPPTETREIGEKIAASPVATQLVQRIRDVPRRRRVTAPAPDGTGGGLDPNLMSEYLDNSLPANLVADVERICLESDVNLAEAAACHQILTLVLGEPVAISGRLRERMYALGPEGTLVDVPDAPPPSKNVRETNAREQLAAIQASEKPARAIPAANRSLESRLPEYLRKPPLWKRMLPWAAAALLLAAWLGWLFIDPTLFGIPRADDDTTEPPGEQIARADQPARDLAEPPPPAPAPKPVEQAGPATEPPIDPPPPEEEIPLMTGDADAATPATQPPGESDAETNEETEPVPTIPTPANEVPPPTAEENAIAATKPGGPNEEPSETSTLNPPLNITSRRGVVLNLRKDSELWYPVPRGENPPAGAPLAVPVPFEADVAIGDSPLNFALLGGTRLTPLGSTTAAPIGIDLSQGRVRITNPEPEDTDPGDLRFALRLGEALWRVEPLAADTTIGIEAQPLKPTEPGQNLSNLTPQAILYVPTGGIRLADSNGNVETIQAPGRTVLSPGETSGQMAEAAPMGDPAVETGGVGETGETGETGEAASDAIDVADLIEPEQEEPAAAATENPETTADSEGGAEASDIPDAPAVTPQAAPLPAETLAAQNSATLPAGFPAWLTPQTPTPAVAHASENFAAEFLSGVPVDESLLPAINSRYFYISEPAAQGLALIENVDGMLKTLRDAELQETRRAAFEGLRAWLGRSPENGELLRDRLRVTFGREDLVEILYRLLWGFDMEDARDLETSQQLIVWLDHPEIVVRELAFHYVQQLSGRDFDYRPSLSPNRRSSSIKRWQDFVARNDGLVLGEE